MKPSEKPEVETDFYKTSQAENVGEQIFEENTVFYKLSPYFICKILI